MGTQSIHGKVLHFTEMGSGEPLVMLHGFPLDGRMWDAQLATLSKNRRVIVPDFPGFGNSESAGPMTVDSMAEGVHDLLLKIGALPCALAGLSMGGYVSLAFIKKYPADVSRLLLVDTKAEADSAEAREGRAKMIELARSAGSVAVGEKMLEKLVTPATREKNPAVMQALRQMIAGVPPQTIVHALEALRDRPDRTEMLPSIAVPTLVVVGEEDAITPVAVAKSMQEKIPHARLAIIPQAGHMSPMENPVTVNAAIAEFLGQRA